MLRLAFFFYLICLVRSPQICEPAGLIYMTMLKKLFRHISDMQFERRRPAFIALFLAAAVAFFTVFAAPSAGAETNSGVGAKKVFSSKKPAGDEGIFDEISRYVDSLTIQIKNLGGFINFLSVESASESAAVHRGNIEKFKSVSAKCARQKNEFELLYRDFVSLRVKDNIIKTEQSVKNDNVIEFDFKNANLVDISYEITLLESVLHAKNLELKSLNAEIDSFSTVQDELVNSIAKAGAVPVSGGESLEIIINAMTYGRKSVAGYEVAIAVKAADAYCQSNQSRYLELKLYCLGQQKKVINYEISATRTELEQKRRMNLFIKDNSLLFAVNKRQSGLTTEELELSRVDLADNKPRLDESLKKINLLMEEIKKEKGASDNKADSWKLKFLNMSLQFEQEMLKHKSNFSSETDELSKFLVKLANYSAKAAEEETDNIQKLFLFTSGAGLYDKKIMLRDEIDEYKKQREEAQSLRNLIKSGRIKIENQIKVLNGDLAVKDRESAEVLLLMRKDAAPGREHDVKALKESIDGLIKIIKTRLTGNEQHIQSALKYEQWLQEKVKTIDNSVKVLSSLVNQLEERLDLKTLSEAYNAFYNIIRSAYYKIESAPSLIISSLASKKGWIDLLIWLKNLSLVIAGALLAYAFITSLFFRGVSSGAGFKSAAGQILPYLLLAAAVKIYSALFMINTAMVNVLTLSAYSFAAFKALIISLHNMQVANTLDSDIFFRFSLFIKYLFFATLALIVVDNASESAHVSILAKFAYKSVSLLLMFILAKKYAHLMLSYLYISRRRLKIRKYGSSFMHLASLYNHLLHKYHSLISVILLITAVVYFAGYYQHSFYILNSSFLTLILYSILFLAPKFAMMTFEWLFSEESALLDINSYLYFKKRAVVYIRIFYRLFFIVIFAFFTLKIWGIRVHSLIDLATAEPVVFIGKKVVMLTAIIATGFLCWHLAEKFIDDLFKSALSHQTSDNIKKRGATIAPMLKSTVKYLIWFLGIYLILKEIGVDVTPIVAGAGIFALAIGFGAQNLVKDIVAGFFIIFEDQYNVGDYVTIEGISGTIEEISIRITKIRDLTGILHIIPNGAITRTSNFSKDFSVSRFEVSVAYESDFDHAIEVLEKTSSELCMDWSLFIIEPTQVLGIVSLGESEVVIRTQTKLTVGKKVDFECELRKRILKEFRENNIEIPYKRLVVLSDKEDVGSERI